MDAGENNEGADPGPNASDVMKKKRRALDLIYGVVGLFMQVGTGLVMLPLTATMLAPSELTFWSVFLAIQAFSYLIEFGFTPTFARNFTYVLNGADRLVAEGVPSEKSGAVNLVLLRELLSTSQKLYAILALIVLLVLGIGGTYYIAMLARTAEDVSYIWTSWALFVGTLVFHTYMNWQACVVMGADRMREYYQVITVARLAQVVLSVAGLIIYQGILSLVVAYAISAIVMRLHYQFIARDVGDLVKEVPEARGAVRRIMRVVAPNAIRSGWTTVGAYFTTRFSFLVISLALGASLAAEYAIAQQAFFALMAISIVVGQLNNTRMTSARISRDMPVLRDMYAFSVFFGCTVFLCGSAAMVLLGEPILQLIGSQTLLPPVPVLAAMTVIIVLDIHANFAMGYIVTGNSIPHMRAVLVTGVAVAVSVGIVYYMKGDLLTFVLVQGVMQACYNFWRWPLQVYRELEITPRNFLPAAFAGARRMLFERL